MLVAMRQWSRRDNIVYGMVMSALLFGCAKEASIPGLGQVPWNDICPDANCGTQGQDVRIASHKNGAHLVASDPSKFLGAKMNPDALDGSPKACGSRAAPAAGSQTATVHGTVDLRGERGAKFKASLSAEISRELKNAANLAPNPPKNSLMATIDRVTSEAIAADQTFEAATYSLTPAAYKAQIDACGGQSASARVTRSITVVRISIDSSAKIRDALASRITAEAELKDVLLAGGGAGESVRSLVDKIVGMKLANYTFVVAIGFDKV
jgi:hypothetical protein